MRQKDVGVSDVRDFFALQRTHRAPAFQIPRSIHPSSMSVLGGFEVEVRNCNQTHALYELAVRSEARVHREGWVSDSEVIGREKVGLEMSCARRILP